MSYLGVGIFMWFFTIGKEWCHGRGKPYFEKEESWCFFMREGFPRELIDVHWYTHIMNMICLFCKILTSSIPSRMRRYRSSMLETNGLSSLNQFFLFFKVPKYFSSCLGNTCQVWGSLEMKLILNLTSPFGIAAKINLRERNDFP